MGFLPGSFCLGLFFGFVVPPSCTFFLGVRFLAVSFLALECVFFRDFKVPFMPAWAIDKAFLKSSMMFFIAMPHHARAAHLSLVPPRFKLYQYPILTRPRAVFSPY